MNNISFICIARQAYTIFISLSLMGVFTPFVVVVVVVVVAVVVVVVAVYQ